MGRKTGVRYACLKDSQGQEEDSSQEDAGGSSSDGYLSVPGRALQWLEEPNNLRNFQLCLSAQSVVLAVLYSFWQVWHTQLLCRLHKLEITFLEGFKIYSTRCRH